MPTHHLFLCSACGNSERRYPNARQCRKCGGALVRQDTTLGNLASQMTALGAENEALRDRAERAEAEAVSLQRALDQQTARAEILAAQVAGWAAQCAAQVDVLQDVQSFLHGARYDAETLKQRVAVAVETDAGAVLLAELDRLRGVLRNIRAAAGPNEMRRLAREALGEDDQAKASGQ